MQADFQSGKLQPPRFSLSWLVERDFVLSSLGVVSSSSVNPENCDEWMTGKRIVTGPVWNWPGLGGVFGGWWPIRLWKEREHVWQGQIGATGKANVILIEKRGNWMSEGKNNAGISLIGFYSIVLRDLFLHFNAIEFKKNNLQFTKSFFKGFSKVSLKEFTIYKKNSKITKTNWKKKISLSTLFLKWVKLFASLKKNSIRDHPFWELFSIFSF